MDSTRIRQSLTENKLTPASIATAGYNALNVTTTDELNSDVSVIEYSLLLLFTLTIPPSPLAVLPLFFLTEYTYS